MEHGRHSVLQPPTYEKVLDKACDSIIAGESMTVEVAQGTNSKSAEININSVEGGIVSGVFRDDALAKYAIEISSLEGDSSKPAVALIRPR